MPIGELATDRFRDYIISAASDPAEWVAALNDIAQRSDSAGAVLFNMAGTPGTPVSESAQRMFEAYWQEDWMHRDARLRGTLSVSMPVLGDDDLFTEAQMKREPIYADLLERMGFRWFAGVFFPVRGQTWSLSLHRTAAQGLFSPEEKKQMLGIVRVMSDAGNIARLVADSRTGGMTKTLDELGDLWMTYDFNGRLIEQGGASQQQSGRADGTRTLEDLLKEDPLRAAVAYCIRIARLGVGSGAKTPEARVDFQDGRSVEVKGIRLAGMHAGFGRAQFLVVCREQKRLQHSSPEALRTRYGLTPAEGQLASLLATGLKLKEAADIRSITHETARAQLKSIFTKVDVTSQTQLVSKLLTG